MQRQPLEERLASLETSAERHAHSIARMDAMLENHDQLMERLVANQVFLQENLTTLQASQERMQITQERTQITQEGMQTSLDRMQDIQARMQANHEAIVSLLEEVTREAANTRRLWLRLAQRYGWIDDEQNGAQPETPP